MRPNTRTLTFAGLTVLAGGLLIGAVTGALGPQEPRLREVTADLRQSEIEVLEIRAFQVDEPFTHWWRKEQPEVRSGLLIVLRTEPELVKARQHAESVLYVGDQTAERLNHGDGTTDAGSRNLVVLVPAPLDAGGRVALDLATTPIWFGGAELPERVDARVIRDERRIAEANGVGAARLAARAEKFRPVDDVIYARDRDELDFTIADLIEFYSPGEVDLIEQLRLPRTN